MRGDKKREWEREERGEREKIEKIEGDRVGDREREGDTKEE